MTLNELTKVLGMANPEAALIFDAPTGRTGPGYHVTEFKRADIESIDCGGTKNAWREVVLQIRDGRGLAHMKVGKFLEIASRSATAVDGLADADLRIEFAADNARLEVLNVNAPIIEDRSVIVPLGASHATCKPMQRAKAKSVKCCGGTKSQECCV